MPRKQPEPADVCNIKTSRNIIITELWLSLQIPSPQNLPQWIGCSEGVVPCIGPRRLLLSSRLCLTARSKAYSCFHLIFLRLICSAAVQSLVHFLSLALPSFCRHRLAYLQGNLFPALQCHVGSTVPSVPITIASTKPANYGERPSNFASASLWLAVASWYGSGAIWRELR